LQWDKDGNCDRLHPLNMHITGVKGLAKAEKATLKSTWGDRKLKLKMEDNHHEFRSF
jgi:hypothetical protein